jgi:lipid-binding SYLF domain-containing protein
LNSADTAVRSFVDTHNNGLDKVIPRYVLERAAGFAIFTVAKAGFLFSARAGSGLVIARTEDGSWSPPTAIAVGGVGFGGQAGAEVTDFLIVLNSRAAVATFMSAGSLTLGGNLSIAVGPLGRNAEGSGSLNTKGQLAAMYSYSKTKGLFGGVSLEGTVIAERQDANRLAYGGSPTAKQILTGAFDPPDWAYVLIDMLDRSTGLPGGQTWVEDSPKDSGAMGWSSPHGGRTGAGYAFGEGVGAGGSTSNRKRSSSLFSIGGNSKARDDAAASAMFYSSPATPSPNHTGSSRGRTTPLDERAPPARPWEVRRASSLIPFSKSMNFANLVKDKDRKMGPSSESYNSNNDSDYFSRESDRPSRRNSVMRPYSAKPTPSPFASELDGSRSGTPRNGTPRHSPPPTFGTRSPVSGSDRSSSDRDHDLLGSDEWGSRGSAHSQSQGQKISHSHERDLLGSWDADPHGLTTNFAKLSTSHNEYANGNGHMNGFGSKGLSPNRTPNRSRGNSRASQTPFDPIDEVRVHETTSTYATRDWALPDDMVPSREKKRLWRERKERPFSSYAAPAGWNWKDEERKREPEVDLTYDDHRPFDDYIPTPKAPAPKPNLALKAGLDAADGYARAVALYNFAASDSGDLALRKGEVVTILDSDGDAGEWWKGRSTSGQSGLFPANYVEVLDIPRDLRGGVTRSMLRRRVLAFDP